MNIELQNQIVDLYVNHKVKPTDIARRLGFTHHQSVYNLLKKEGVFVKHYTGGNTSRTYHVDESYFEAIDTAEKAYTLGFIAADGFVDETRNALKVSLNEQDVDVLEKILSSMSSNHPIKRFTKDGKYSHVSFDIGSKKIVSDLKRLGLYSGKSLTMTGDILQHVEAPFRRDFLRGYFDGDGNIFYGKSYTSGVKFCLTVIGTEDFLRKTFEVMCSTNCKISKYKSCNMYSWRVAAKGMVDICLDYLYKDSVMYLDRKYDQYLQSKTYVRECAHVKPGELLEPLIGQSAAEPVAIREGSETIEKQSEILIEPSRVRRSLRKPQAPKGEDIVQHHEPTS